MPEDKKSKVEMVHIQFRVPKAAADRFDKMVYDKYGLKHGGKTQTFLDMIEETGEGREN